MSNNDRFFEIIAKQYMEKEGEDLKKLAEKLNDDAMDTSRLDFRVKNSIKKDKQRRFYMVSSVAASVLIIFFSIYIFRGIQSNTNMSTANNTMSTLDNAMGTSNTTDMVFAMEMMSNKLPAGFVVSNVDYDIGKTIYYVLGNNNNIVIEESTDEKLNTEGLKEIDISNVKAYGISKADYSLITFEYNGKLYTLTSPYDAYDLINIGESIIKSS